MDSGFDTFGKWVSNMMYAIILDYTLNQISQWWTLALLAVSFITITVSVVVCPEDGYLQHGFGDFIVLSVVGVILYLTNIHLNGGTFSPPSKLLFLVDAFVLLRGMYLCSRSVVSWYMIPIGVAVGLFSGYLLAMILVFATYVCIQIVIPIIIIIVLLVVAKYFFTLDIIAALLNGVQVSFIELYVFIKELTKGK